MAWLPISEERCRAGSCGRPAPDALPDQACRASGAVLAGGSRAVVRRSPAVALYADEVLLSACTVCDMRPLTHGDRLA